MISPERSRILRVRLLFPAGLRPPPGALLRLRVEDVSKADAAAEPIVEQMDKVSPGGAAVIKVPAGLIDPKATYSVFIHVDANRSGRIEPGDFISPAVHPVLTHGAPDAIEASLVRVGG